MKINLNWPKDKMISLGKFDTEREAVETVEAILNKLYPKKWYRLNDSQWGERDQWGGTVMAVVERPQENW